VQEDDTLLWLGVLLGEPVALTVGGNDGEGVMVVDSDVDGCTERDRVSVQLLL